MMRLASAMMVLTLMSTSVISGTFAKYVTSDSATDTARVAKWGVTVVQEGPQEIFAAEYDDVGGTVKSSNEDKLVAPGTKNTAGLKFKITGTPEVSCKIEIKSTNIKDVVLKAGDYVDDPTTGGAIDPFNLGADYTPVVYTMTGNNIGGTGVDTLSGTLEDVLTAFDSLSCTVSPNTDLGAKFGTYVLTWAWEFENADPAIMKVNDRNDTLLGNYAAGTTVENASSTDIHFDLEITVTQID